MLCLYYLLSPPFPERLPLEVEERIIDHLESDTISLRRSGLTCRAWRVRSRFNLLKDIYIEGTVWPARVDRFFQTNPHLRPIVASLTVHIPLSTGSFFFPACFARLPHLHRWSVRYDEGAWEAKSTTTGPVDGPPPVVGLSFHHSTIALLANHASIEELVLSNVAFASENALMHLLVGLPRLAYLRCSKVWTVSASHRTLHAGRPRPRKTVQLRSLVDVHIRDFPALLEAARHTVQVLVLTVSHCQPTSGEDVAIGTFPQLRSFELVLVPASYSASSDRIKQSRDFSLDSIGKIDGILRQPRPDYLETIRILLPATDSSEVGYIQHPAVREKLRSLEATVLGPSVGSLEFVASKSKANRMPAVRSALGTLFPALEDAGKLAISFTRSVCDPILSGHDLAVLSLSVSQDGQRVATVSTDSIIVWRASTGAIITEPQTLNPLSPKRRRRGARKGLASATLPPSTALSGISANAIAPDADVAFAPDGTLLAVGGESAHIAIQDIQGSHVAILMSGAQNGAGHPSGGWGSCRWSAQQRLLAATSRSGGHIGVWDTAMWSLLFLFAVDLSLGLPHQLRLSVDGRWLLYWQTAVGNRSSGCTVIDLDAAASLRKGLRGDAGPLLKASSPTISPICEPGWILHTDASQAGVYRDLKGHGVVECASFSPVAPTMVATGSRDGTIRIWDAETGAELARLEGHTGTIPDVSFSPDGSRVLAACADGTPSVWAVASGQRLHSLAGHAASVRAVCYSPAGDYLASASEDGTVRLWDALDGSCVAVFTEHRDAKVTLVAFAAGWETLVSAASDGTVCFRPMHVALGPLACGKTV